MSTNPQPQNTLAPQENIPLVPYGNQSDTNQDNYQDDEAARANPRVDNGQNTLVGTPEELELCRYGQSTIKVWFPILVTISQLGWAYPDVYSGFEGYFTLITLLIALGLMVYLDKCPKFFGARALANIVMFSVAGVAVTSLIFIELIIKSWGSPGPFPDKSGFGYLLISVFLRVAFFATALFFIQWAYGQV